MPDPLVPATPAFDAAGTPFSPRYGDIYHSAESGPGQTRHVFLGGNDLPARWSGARVYTIVETGFGIGLNFLATWQAWREDAARAERLHFVSIEKHPFTREGMTTLHARYPEFAPLAAQLQSVWPLPLSGLHRLEFEDGRVTLTVAFADAADILPRLRLAADAFYLDGFAPGRNPDMWTPQVMEGLARLARPGATLSTYSAARPVRDALSAAGFQPELRPGFGSKRDMLAARYLLHRGQAAAPKWDERRALVIGAGLAGAAVTERLAARGWHIDLIERHPAPAMGASAIPAGVFHPHVSRDDSILSRLTRVGFLYALGRWRALEAAGLRLSWASCGVLQLAKGAREEARMAATVRALAFPPAYVDYLERGRAGERAGRDVRAGGWWFPDSGWMRPDGLIAAQLKSAGARFTLHAGATVHALSSADGNWRALAPDGAVIASAPVAVLANSNDGARLAPLGAPLKRVRGQLTCLPEGSLAGLRAVAAGSGHVLPGGDGSAVVGATYDFEGESAGPEEEGHRGNLERLEQLLPGSARQFDPALLKGSVGFRCVAADRLPLIGALPDAAAEWPDAHSRALSVPRMVGLYGAFAYGSRGLTWAALGGEVIASLIEGEPLPLESDLLDAVDPGRFLLRHARRGGG